MTADSEATLYTLVTSPIGELLLAGTEQALASLAFAGPEGHRVPAGWRRSDAALQAAAQQIDEYFAGRRRQFDLDIAPRATPFQAEVLAELRRIPYGETRSYADIARALGRPRAVRAVGAANGRNPLPIIIPCHRVIGSNGALTGFGGGLPAKRFLLDLERQGVEGAVATAAEDAVAADRPHPRALAAATEAAAPIAATA